METIEKSLVVAGMEALRQVGGDVLVQVLLGQAGKLEFARADILGDKVPIEDYLRYRDTALDFLQESFSMTAFQTGQIVVRNIHREKESQIRKLIERFEYAQNKLPVIGQAAVLAAKENPGIVRATMRSESLLAITIENCPECRGLRKQSPFCYLNQGVISEFAERFLKLQVNTRETKCMATGDPACEIEVSLYN
jgi:predicted hydrocarbon binding protein